MAGPQHIVDLLRNIPKDIHRPNLFEVEFSPPKTVSTANKIIAQNLVKSVNIPRTSIEEMNIRRMGLKISIPAGTQFEVVVFNIHDDSESKARSFFMDWQRNHFRDIQSGRFNKDLRNMISGSCEIFQLDAEHRRTTKITIKNAWPQIVGELEMSHDTEDSILNFNVTYQFNYIYFNNNPPFSNTTGI